MSIDEKTKAWASKQPKKIVAIKVILRSEKGNVLLVRPTFKPGWQLPGGGVDALESPEEAAIREIHEELDIQLPLSELRIVGMVQLRDFDNLMIILEATRVIGESVQLRIQKSEIEDYYYEQPSKVANQISDYYQDFWAIYLDSTQE